MWPFRRGRAPDATAPASNATDGWRDAPAMPRSPEPAPGTFGTADFEAGLVTRRPPTFLEGLGHDVTVDGPSGVITGLLEPTWSAPVTTPGGARRSAAAHLQRFSRASARALAGQTMSFGGEVALGGGVRELPIVEEPAQAFPARPSLTVAPPLPVTPAPLVADEPEVASEEDPPDAEPPVEPRAVPETVRPLGLGPPIAGRPGSPVQRSIIPPPAPRSPRGLGRPSVVQRQRVAPAARAPIPPDAPPASVAPLPQVTGGGTGMEVELADAVGPGPTVGPAAASPAAPEVRPVGTTPAAGPASPADTVLQRIERAPAPPAPPGTTAAAVARRPAGTSLQRVDTVQGVEPTIPLQPAGAGGRPAVRQASETIAEPTVQRLEHAPAAGSAPPRPLTGSTGLQRLDDPHAAAPTVRPPGKAEPQPMEAGETAVLRRPVGTARQPVESTEMEAAARSTAIVPAVPGPVAVQRRAGLASQRPPVLRAAPPATAMEPALAVQRAATAAPERPSSTRSVSATLLGAAADAPSPRTSLLPPAPILAPTSRATTVSPAIGGSVPTMRTAAGETQWTDARIVPAPAVAIQRRGMRDLAPLLGGWSQAPGEQPADGPATEDFGEMPMAVAAPAANRPRQRFLDIVAAASPLASAVSSGFTSLEPDGSPAFARDAAAPPPAGTTVQPATGAPVASGEGGGGSGPAAVDTRSITTEQLDELARRLYDRIRDRLKAELRIDRERRGRVTDLVE